jgi:ubiquinone/menaquinone biosynthesis C-methylase UbiE
MTDQHSRLHWDNAARQYEALAAPFTQAFARVAIEPLELTPADHVIDIACGTGAATRVAADTGAAVTAIDFSQGMIDRVDAARLPNVHARQMDGQNLVFPDASFDAAVSTFGIMLFPDWQLGLREMARVLRPGGRAAMTTWADPDGAAVNLLLVDVRRSLFPDLEAVPPPGGMRVLADAERLRSALKLAGFRDVLVKQVSHAFLLPLYVLDNADLSFRVLPHWTSLTVQQQHQTVAEFRRRATGATSISIPSTANVAVMSRA